MSPEPTNEAEPPRPPEHFANLLGRIGALEDDQSDLIARYLAELDSWRRRINLTGRLSADELVAHALESLPATALIAEDAEVIDIGSGSGFPAIPLSILTPEASFALFEPTAKKASFLRHVVRTLDLTNVDVHAARVEDVGGQTFDVATTRAVGSLGAVLGSAPFLRRGGRLLVWTTDPEGLAGELSELRLARSVPIPGSRTKSIALFEKPAG